MAVDRSALHVLFEGAAGEMAADDALQLDHSRPLGHHRPSHEVGINRLADAGRCRKAFDQVVGHDENISIERAREIFGVDLVDRLAQTSLAVFARGSAAAAKAGIVLADTKFEFGYVDDELLLCDEVLTPDSSRFWDADALEPGREPVQFDKQPLRDYLESTGWEKTPPPPALPGEVLDTLAARYRSVYERITGASFEGWLERARAAASTGATPFGD